MDKDYTYSFDPRAHIHRINGLIVPGTTAVCESESLSDYSFLPEDVRAAALDFGQDVHTATELYDRGELDMATVDWRVGGCLEAYQRLHREHRIQMMFREEPAGHARAGQWFGCVIDIAGKFDGLNAIVEIKTGIPAAWHGPQLGAQREAMRFHHGFVAGKAYAAYLNEDGNYKLAEYSQDLEAHYSAFLSALNLYNWRKQYVKR